MYDESAILFDAEYISLFTIRFGFFPRSFMKSPFPMAHLFRHPWVAGLTVATLTTVLGVGFLPARLSEAIAQTAPASDPEARQPLRLESDIQEANSITGVITARGNVRIFYPARQIQATAVQAQYFSRERRIVLTGDVYVLQAGNSMRGEAITYLLDEGRFVAFPDQGEQVETIYLVPDDTLPETVPGAAAAPEEGFNPKPDFKGPTSNP